MELWYIDIDAPLLGIDETDGDSSWASLMALATAIEVEKINKFIFFIDKKRALLSICMQHALIRSFLQHNYYEFGDYSILRTSENKPYAKFDKAIVTNWNYNVSHHGKYVAIASHMHCSIGIDIVDIATRSNCCSSSSEYVNMFVKQLHPSELACIYRAQEEDRYAYFFLFWALKESYVKAIGCGIADNLASICFIINDVAVVDSSSTINGDAQLVLNDFPRHDWLFKFSSIDKTHIVAVALGPKSDAFDIEKERSITLDSLLQEKTVQSLLTTDQLAEITGSLLPPATTLISTSDSNNHLRNKSCTTT